MALNVIISSLQIRPGRIYYGFRFLVLKSLSIHTKKKSTSLILSALLFIELCLSRLIEGYNLVFNSTFKYSVMALRNCVGKNEFLCVHKFNCNTNALKLQFFPSSSPPCWEHPQVTSSPKTPTMHPSASLPDVTRWTRSTSCGATRTQGSFAFADR